MAVDRLDDLLAGGQRVLNVAVEDEAELVLGVDVGRIGAGDAERVAFLGDREDRVFAGHALGEEVDDILLDGHPRQIDKLQPVGLRQRPHHLVARRVAEPHDLVVELLA